MKKHGCWDTGCAIYRAMIEPFPELKHTVVCRSIMKLTTFESIIITCAKCIIMSRFMIDGDKNRPEKEEFFQEKLFLHLSLLSKKRPF